MKNYAFKRPLLTVFILTFFTCSCNREKIIFHDDFGKGSEGIVVDNVIHLPPPAGLSYTWKVLSKGALPVNWIFIDELDKSDPKKGFWVIPPDSGYLEQGGRSHNSVLFANVPVPDKTTHFDISFRQYRADNDYIGYIIGSDEPRINGGIEFGYMTQVPGTDSTTVNAYIQGDLGESEVKNAAFMHKWASHMIKVRGDSIYWSVNGIILSKGKTTGKSSSGYFGIRQRYERGTRYDDFKITQIGR
jgi:hypothetical protein